MHVIHTRRIHIGGTLTGTFSRRIRLGIYTLDVTWRIWGVGSAFPLPLALGRWPHLATRLGIILYLWGAILPLILTLVTPLLTLGWDISLLRGTIIPAILSLSISPSIIMPLVLLGILVVLG